MARQMMIHAGTLLQSKGAAAVGRIELTHLALAAVHDPR
jgi:hypothetical protein